MSPRTGRRPGKSGTRDAILDAARASFTVKGYDGATIRDVARRAGVDPALVHHYFENKQKLFLAAVEVPFDPTVIVESVLDGEVDSLGERIARTFLLVWDGRAGRSQIVSLIRSATSNEHAARMLREFISTEILGRITRSLELPDARLRATLVGSQLIGVALMRYVIAVEPLASVPQEDVAGMIAPTLQRYLTGDLLVSAKEQSLQRARERVGGRPNAG
jgi:AcrR family transcriptional regulator